MLRGLILIIPACLWAQEPLQFEAASIKPYILGSSTRSGIEETPGLIRIENLPLKAVIELAYGVKDYQFDGPDWLSGARFDITAKPPAGYKHEQLQPLLRNLLAARFKLTVHHDSRQLSGYALVIAKGGARLQESTGPKTFFTVRPGLISGTQRSLEELTGALARMLSRPVVDQTGLMAAYDIKLEWTQDPEQELSTFAALQEQLGLRLQPQKVPIDIVIVDHIEKTPTEN
jgi:uncharacterized protein (TIGR03435 family)